jgi:hypothetical protein
MSKRGDRHDGKQTTLLCSAHQCLTGEFCEGLFQHADIILGPISFFIMNKALYLVLAVNLEGQKELLGMWIAQSEGAKFWLSVLDSVTEPWGQRLLHCMCGWADRLARSDCNRLDERRGCNCAWCI